DRSVIDQLFEQAGHVVALDSLVNETTQQAEYLLPAGTFAESTGTVVSNEGRAQRFFQVYKPDEAMQSSWAWLVDIEGKGETYHFDQVVEDMIADFPELKPVEEAAPKADFRDGTQKIPRSPHRF